MPPSLSLAGVQLAISDHGVGLPVLRTLSLCTCPPPVPRYSSRASSSLVSPGHISLPRYTSRVGLHVVLFEACSAFTHVAACTSAPATIRGPLSEGFSHFVTSMTAPVASGWSDLAGWDLHPLESAALSRRTVKADL